MLFIQLIFVQGIVFGCLIYFLKKILYGDTQSAMKRLDHVYHDMLQKQKDLAQKIEHAENEYKERKEEAQKVGAKLKNEALAEARKKEDELIKHARGEAQQIVDKARGSVEKNKRELEKTVRADLVGSAVELLQVAIGEKTAEALHRQLFEEFLLRGKEYDLSGLGEAIGAFDMKSAFELSEDEKQKINKLFSEKLGRELAFKYATDKQLMAGIVIQFGTLILDGTLVNQLKEKSIEMKRNIQNQA